MINAPPCRELKDLYGVLGCRDRAASMDEVRKLYKTKSRETHPDKGGSKEEFQKVHEAYSILGDPKERFCYDFCAEHGPTKFIPTDYIAPYQAREGWSWQVESY